jgi:hypothetical protein
MFLISSDGKEVGVLTLLALLPARTQPPTARYGKQHSLLSLNALLPLYLHLRGKAEVNAREAKDRFGASHRTFGGRAADPGFIDSSSLPVTLSGSVRTQVRSCWSTV